MKRSSINIITLIIIFLFVSVNPVNAQDGKKGQWGLFGGLGLPTGDFGGDNISEGVSIDGFAAMGFAIGAEYIIPLNSPGLGIIISPSLIINGFDASAFEKAWDNEGYDHDVSGSSWMNIPLMGGIHYQQAGDSPTSFYGFAMAGINLVNGPTIDTEYTGNANGTEKIEIGSGTSFGFCFGGGLVMNDKYTFSLRLYSLGSPELDLDYDDEWETGSRSESAEVDFSISIILFSVGMRL